MKKIELREQGFSETTYCQKDSAGRMIWAVSTILIIALNIVSSAANTLGRNNIILDFFHTIGYAVDNSFRSYAATSALYLILWALIMFVLYLIAKKSDKVKKPLMQTIFIVLIVAVIFSFMMLISEDYNHSDDRPHAFFGIFDAIQTVLFSKIQEIAIAVMMVLYECIYLGMKFAATRIFCSDGENNIRFRFMHGMPVCYCTEALKSWQTVAMYLIPYAFINSVIYIVNLRSDNAHIVSALFIAFVTSFDMSVVIYALRFKKKYKPDYISIDRHIYEATLFQK